MSVADFYLLSFFRRSTQIWKQLENKPLLNDNQHLIQLYLPIDKKQTSDTFYNKVFVSLQFMYNIV